MREMSNIREVEDSKRRDSEHKSLAELKMRDKLIDSLKRDHKEMEQRIQDIIGKQELINSKSAEEHHNTVKYFEGIVTQLKMQVKSYNIP